VRDGVFEDHSFLVSCLEVDVQLLPTRAGSRVPWPDPMRDLAHAPALEVFWDGRQDRLRIDFAPHATAAFPAAGGLTASGGHTSQCGYHLRFPRPRRCGARILVCPPNYLKSYDLIKHIAENRPGQDLHAAVRRDVMQDATIDLLFDLDIDYA
jgi:hypothetical protein